MWIQFLLIFGSSVAMVAPGLLMRRGEMKRLRKEALASFDYPYGDDQEDEFIDDSFSSKELKAPVATDETLRQRFAAGLGVLELRGLENTGRALSEHVNLLIRELLALEAKIGSMGAQEMRLSYTKYLPMIEKVNELTAPNYYGDFVRHGHNWEDPERMILQVELSVLAVAREIATDIRKLNSSQAINFEITAGTLIGTEAAAPAPKNPEAVLKELLVTSEINDSLPWSDLSSFESAVSAEAEALKHRELQELETEARAKEDFANGVEKAQQYLDLYAEEKGTSLDRKVADHYAASKRAAESNEPPLKRDVLISQSRFGQTFTIYGQLPAGTVPSASSFLASRVNAKTGEVDWNTFSSRFEAAEWTDRAIAEVSRTHDYKCDCEYCS